MSKNKKEIIDNEDGTMAEFLKNALQDNRGQVSIATGYFNVEAMPTCGTLCGKQPKEKTFVSAS